MVFANGIAPPLGIEMPRVGTGTYASPTITTPLTAEAKAKRISARLAIQDHGPIIFSGSMSSTLAARHCTMACIA